MHYSSYDVYPHLAIYFNSPFGRFPTFHILTSVGEESFSVSLKTITAFSSYSQVFSLCVILNHFLLVITMLYHDIYEVMLSFCSKIHSWIE